MKKTIFIILILSIDTAIAMQRPPIRRTRSLSDLHRGNFDDDDGQSTQTSSDDDNGKKPANDEHDELAYLEEQTRVPGANPFVITRGPFAFFHKKQSHRAAAFASTTLDDDADAVELEQHEATWNDVVHLIQSNSRLALSEARMVNTAHIRQIADQLQDAIDSVGTQITGDAKQVVSQVEDLRARFAYVEKLMPEIKRLLAQDATLATQYEQTCNALIKKIEAYHQHIEKNETTHAQEHEQIKAHLRAMNVTLGVINKSTYALEGMLKSGRTSNIKYQLLKYTAGAGALFAIAGLIVWLLGTDDHPTPESDINDNLQEAA